eukprot:1969446-Rhodomonas_salina.1
MLNSEQYNPKPYALFPQRRATADGAHAIGTTWCALAHVLCRAIADGARVIGTRCCTRQGARRTRPRRSFRRRRVSSLVPAMIYSLRAAAQYCGLAYCGARAGDRECCGQIDGVSAVGCCGMRR